MWHLTAANYLKSTMSLGGPCKDCWDDSCGYLDEEVCAFETDYAKVIHDLRQINVLTVVAAGNSDDDACKMSPQAARYAITVGAIERGDSRAYYSTLHALRCRPLSSFGALLPRLA